VITWHLLISCTHAFPLHFYRRFTFYPYLMAVFWMLLILLFISIHFDHALQFAFVNLYSNKSYISLFFLIFFLVKTLTPLIHAGSFPRCWSPTRVQASVSQGASLHCSTLLPVQGGLGLARSHSCDIHGHRHTVCRRLPTKWRGIHFTKILLPTNPRLFNFVIHFIRNCHKH